MMHLAKHRMRHLEVSHPWERALMHFVSGSSWTAGLREQARRPLIARFRTDPAAGRAAQPDARTLCAARRSLSSSLLHGGSSQPIRCWVARCRGADGRGAKGRAGTTAHGANGQGAMARGLREVAGDGHARGDHQHVHPVSYTHLTLPTKA